MNALLTYATLAAMTAAPSHDAPNAPVALRRVGQIAVPVENLERAIAFYEKTLGLKRVGVYPTMAFFQCGELRLMLSRPSKPEFANHASLLYFEVDDIQESYRRLAREEVEFRSKPSVTHEDENSQLWMAFFRDSEGNTLALMSERPKSE